MTDQGIVQAEATPLNRRVGGHTNEVTSSRVAVFGAGVSGRAIAELVSQRGGQAVLFDDKASDAERNLPENFAQAFETFVFSPGISPSHRWQKQVAQYIPPQQIFGELGFALQFWPGRVLGVTGTNGKTTVTLLLEAFLQASARSCVVACGNIGKPCAEVIREWKEASADDWLVVEISSFQAAIPNGIRLDGLVWTNFAPDHLDWHGDLDCYFAAKAKLLSCLNEGAPVVMDAAVASRLGITDSAQDRAACALVYQRVNSTDSQLVAIAQSSPGIALTNLPENFRRLPQLSNWQQVASLLAPLGLLPEPASSSQILQSFAPPPHRLHKVSTVAGIDYWNDSKATNPHAALAALKAFEQPLCWLVGGRNKGIDLDDFAQQAAALLPAGSHVLTFGEAGREFQLALSKQQLNVSHHPDARTLVEPAHCLCKTHRLQTVLLSPGFASFDAFDGYAARGKNFISQVLCLKDNPALA